MRIKSIILIVIFLATGNLYLEAKQSGFCFSLKAGYYMPSSKTINNEIIGQLNELNQGLVNLVQNYGFDANYEDAKKIAGNYSFGAEIQVMIFKGLSLSLGAEYWQNTSKSIFEGSGEIGRSSINAKSEDGLESRLIQILGTIRYYVLSGKINIYAGSGTGYYLAEVSLFNSYNVEVNGIETADDELYEMAGKKNQVLPHVNLGIEIPILRWLSLCGDIRYVIGNITNFETTKDTIDPSNEGKSFTYLDNTGNRKDFIWEMNGANVGIFMRLRF